MTRHTLPHAAPTSAQAPAADGRSTADAFGAASPFGPIVDAPGRPIIPLHRMVAATRDPEMLAAIRDGMPAKHIDLDDYNSLRVGQRPANVEFRRDLRAVALGVIAALVLILVIA